MASLGMAHSTATWRKLCAKHSIQDDVVQVIHDLPKGPVKTPAGFAFYVGTKELFEEKVMGARKGQSRPSSDFSSSTLTSSVPKSLRMGP